MFGKGARAAVRLGGGAGRGFGALVAVRAGGGGGARHLLQVQKVRTPAPGRGWRGGGDYAGACYGNGREHLASDAGEAGGKAGLGPGQQEPAGRPVPGGNTAGYRALESIRP